MKMFSKIVFTVLLALPLILFLSDFLSRKINARLEALQEQLSKIESEDFSPAQHRSGIEEIDTIYHSLDTLSLRLGDSIESLNRQNDELLLTITAFAHDVKTPLTIMQGRLEELADHVVSPNEHDRYYAKLLTEIRYIDTMASKTIDFGHSKNVTTNPESIQLAPFLRTLIARFEHPFEIICGHDETIEFTVIDLKRIFNNLLSNAVRFSNDTPIRVIYEKGVLSIENQGKPIPESIHQTLFKPFISGDTTQNRHVSGLGLAIVRNLCERNGWIIHCDCDYKQGARFKMQRRDS